MDEKSRQNGRTYQAMSRRSVLAATTALLGAGATTALSKPAAARSVIPVALGESTTFTEYDWEMTSTRSDGIVLDRNEGNVDLSENRLQADVRAVTGVGKAVRNVLLGVRINARGDEPQIAHVSTDGHLTGRLRSVAGTSASAHGRILVVKVSEGNRRRESYFIERSASGGLTTKDVDNHLFGGGVHVEMQPGNNYQVWVGLSARINSSTSQLGLLPRSDFSTNDGGMFVDEISVTF